MTPRWFEASDPQFERAFDQFLAERRGAGPEEASLAAAAIISDVRSGGGEAVRRHTLKFDATHIDPVTLQAEGVDLERAAAAVDPQVRDALDKAAERIEAYHARLMPVDGGFADAIGMEFSWRWTPIDAVGLYVPGGRAAYPSSVLMNAIPARTAGVKRLAMVSPVQGGTLNPAVAYAALRSGVTEHYPIGGAQAVAALAFGAGDLKPVDKIVGPGNAWVTAAKRIVFGVVGIDTIAGPSEITVVADANNDPDWIAADLLSQAEHDPLAQAILIVDDPVFAQAVADAASRMIREQGLGAAETAWRNQSAIVIAPLSRAAAIVNRIAPEHVEIATETPEPIAQDVRHAGAIFLGRWAPEALGDYVTGSNHVLPTSGAARFASGLSVADFMKRMSIQRISQRAFSALSDPAETLARAEGLPAHALSISIRRNRT